MSAKRYGFRRVAVDCGIFEYRIECVVGPFKNLAKYIGWKFEDPKFGDDLQEAHGWCLHKKGFVPVIWLPRVPRSPREIGTLSHEALHAINTMLQWAGMEPSEDNEEVVCHALGFLVTEILTKLRAK